MNCLLKATTVAAALCAAFTGAASATTLTFGDFATTTDNAGPNPTPIVSVNDDVAGFLSFSIGTSGTVGNLSGIAFDISGIALSEADIVNESVALAGFGTFATNFGGGFNLSGGYTDGTNSPIFDFGLRIAQTDVSTTPFTFQVSTSLLSLDDIEDVGLRFQSVASPAGSAKILGSALTHTPAPVPLPAAGWLLLVGLGGLAAMRRRTA